MKRSGPCPEPAGLCLNFILADPKPPTLESRSSNSSLFSCSEEYTYVLNHYWQMSFEFDTGIHIRQKSLGISRIFSRAHGSSDGHRTRAAPWKRMEDEANQN